MKDLAGRFCSLDHWISHVDSMDTEKYVAKVSYSSLLDSSVIRTRPGVLLGLGF